MLRNSFFSIVSTGVRLLTGLVMFLIMAHTWGPKSFGIFMYPFTIAAIMVKVVDYGFALQLMRDIGKAPDQVRAIMGRALGAKLVLLVPMGVAAAIVGAMLPSGGPYGILFALLLCDAVTNSFAMFFNIPLRALERFDIEAYIVTGSNLTLFTTVAVIVLSGFGPVAAAVGFALARLVFLGASWVASKRVLGQWLRVQLSFRPLLASLKLGFPFAVHAAVGMLTMQVDTLLVQHYLGAGGVGIYQAGMRVLLGALLVADALNNVYLATLAQVTSERAEVNRLGTRMTRHLLTIGIIAFLCTVGGSNWIVRLLFSHGYDQLIHILPFFGLLMFIRYGGVSYGTILTLADKQVIRVFAVIGALFLGIVVNVLLIPRFGLTGAIWAAIISNVGLYSVYAAATWRDYRTLLVDWRSKTLVLIAGATLLLLFLPGTDQGAMRLQVGVLLIAVSALVGVTRGEWTMLSRKVARMTVLRAS